jgi:hypothetical protein
MQNLIWGLKALTYRLLEAGRDRPYKLLVVLDVEQTLSTGRSNI